jgi:hypothetical protein
VVGFAVVGAAVVVAKMHGVLVVMSQLFKLLRLRIELLLRSAIANLGLNRLLLFLQ